MSFNPSRSTPFPFSQRIVLAAAIALVAFGVQAQTQAPAQPDASPVGLWKTIDDETGKAKSLVRIVEVNGALSGRVEKILTPGKENQVCEKCEGALKDQPVLGMEILQGLRKGDDVWEGGTILDPNNGKTYRSQIKLVEGGNKMELRGYIGIPLLGRSQNWLREQ